MKIEFSDMLVNVCIISIVVLVALKWFGILTISWWLTFMPLWILLAVADVALVAYVLLMKVVKILDALRKD